MVVFILLILILLLIIIYIINYFEICRYISLNKSNWNQVISLDNKYHNLPRVKTKHKTVISLTTIPDRLDKIAPTLCSLLSQSHKIDEIRLNIPYRTLKGHSYHIPKVFNKLEHIKIYRIETDYGPSTKLLPTLLDEPKANIIVVDDDMIYGSCLVNKLVQAFEKHDRKTAITYYGCNRDDNKLSRTKHFFNGNNYVYLLFGCGGYILKADMLPKDVFDYSNSPDEAKFVDDNWISGWLWLNKVNIYTIGLSKGTMYLPSSGTIGTTSLCNGVNWNKKNNKIVDDWFISKYKNKDGSGRSC